MVIFICDGFRSEEEKASFYELRLLRDALSLSIGALNVDPTQLPAQLYGRLLAVLVGSDTKRYTISLVPSLENQSQNSSASQASS